MDFLTKIPIKENETKIDYNSKILLLGSCFAENIGEKLDYFKFQTLQNPFGILFHPFAIERLIENAVHKKQYSGRDVLCNNNLWYCFDTHSRLCDSSKENVIEQINNAIIDTHNFIKNATHINITLGTSWVYKHKASDSIVANCHKILQNEFEKHLLSIEQVTESLTHCMQLIHKVNPSAQFIFTVSPVRHIKDGFIENTLSKSHLISAVHEAVFTYEKSNQVCYFPSYEIQMDELRDYRFYKEDMLHPNDMAVAYIWERFVIVWMAGSTKDTMQSVDTIQKGLAHKPFNPDSESHKKFLSKLNEDIDELCSTYAHINFK